MERRLIVGTWSAVQRWAAVMCNKREEGGNLEILKPKRVVSDLKNAAKIVVLYISSRTEKFSGFSKNAKPFRIQEPVR